MQGLAVGVQQELRSLAEVLHAPEDQVTVVVAIAAQVALDHLAQVADGGLGVVAGAMEGVHDQRVAHVIVFHAGRILVFKGLVPQADAVQGQYVAAGAQAEFHVVVAYEYGQRQVCIVDLGHRYAAVPPGVVVRRILGVVAQHILQLRQLQVHLAGVHVIAVPPAAALVLYGPVVQPQHRAGDCFARMLRLQKLQQPVGAHQRVGVDQHVVVHHQHVAEAALRAHVHDLDHAPGEAACAADVLVGEDVHPVAHELLRVQRLAVVGDEHVQMPADGAIRILDELPLEQRHVALHEALPAEGAYVDGDVHRVQLFLVHVGLVPAAVAHVVRALQRLQAEADHAPVPGVAGNDELEGLAFVAAADLLREGVGEVFGVHDVLVHQSHHEAALQLQMQLQVVQAGVHAPLADGEIVEIGVEAQMLPARRVHGLFPGVVIGPLGDVLLQARQRGRRIRRDILRRFHRPEVHLIARARVKIRKLQSL